MGIISITVLFFVLWGLSEAAGAEKADNSSVLIPRSMFIGGDDYRSVHLSHDGRTLAYLAPYNGVANVWIRKLSPPGAPYPLTKQMDRPIQHITWAYDLAQTILYSQDTAGEENYRLFAVSTRGDRSGQVRLLTPPKGVRAHIVHLSARRPNRVVIALNDRNQSCHDYYTMDIRTGERQLYFQNIDCYADLLFDDSLTLRVMAKGNSIGGMDYYKLEKDDTADCFQRIYEGATNGSKCTRIVLLRSVEPDETSSTGALHLDASGNVIYWLDASETDKGLLVAENLITGEQWILYEPGSSEIVALTVQPASRRPLIVYESYLKPKQTILPPVGNGRGEKEEHRSIVSAWRRLRSLLPSNAEPLILSASHDFTVWLVGTQTDNAPGVYWLYRAPTLTYLFSKNEYLARYELSHRRAMEIPTRDGLTELCYLSLPPESVSNPEATFRPDQSIPMVLFVHGGPWARDGWGFSNEIQLLTNRGYAVLQCNYRGSEGFGKSFANAGNGEWGLKMQADLTDAVRWAVKENIAQSDRVAIAGFSYGGYAALEGLTSTPDLYACAVDAVGPSNLLTLMRTLPPYWAPAFSLVKRRFGADPSTEDGKKKLMEASPFFHASKIKRPLLVAHGVNDPRVKLQESDMIVKAAKANNVPVTYVTFKDEGHGFGRPENNLAFWALTEQFLQSCLGGKAEPILDTVQKSTAHLVTNTMS